jgi:hypothetical protein
VAPKRETNAIRARGGKEEYVHVGFNVESIGYKPQEVVVVEFEVRSQGSAKDPASKDHITGQEGVVLYTVFYIRTAVANHVKVLMSEKGYERVVILRPRTYRWDPIGKYERREVSDNR